MRDENEDKVIVMAKEFVDLLKRSKLFSSED
jgi:hypothetical protein